MISRLLIATAVLSSALAGVAVTTAPSKPTLYVFCGPGPNNGPCGGCVAFDRAMQMREFGQPLKQLVSLRGPFDVRDPRAAALVRDYKVTSWPTFVLIDRGQIIRRAVGFENSAEFRSGFLRSLTTAVDMECENGICKPITRTQPAPAPKPANDVEAALLERLKSANESLQAERDQLRYRERMLAEELNDCRESVRTAGSDQQALDAAKYRADELSRQLRELGQQLQATESALARAQTESAELRERLRQPPASPFESGPGPQTLPNPPAATSDISAEMSDPAATNATSETANGWRSVLRSLTVGAVTLAAPQYAIPVSMGLGALAWYRKRKAGPASAPATFPEFRLPDIGAPFSVSNAEPDTGTTANASVAEDEFVLPTLPFQDMDYTKTWADHWVREGKSPELAAQEYSHFVNAFAAVRKGELKLPGVEDGSQFAKQVRNWVARQFRAYTNKQIDNNNPNHRAFYAFLHKQAFENIRNGRFNEAAPNPKAADVLEDWVNDRIVGDLVFTPQP